MAFIQFGLFAQSSNCRLLAQEGSSVENTIKRFSPNQLFRRSKSSGAENQQPTSSTGPSELRVIDRATARQNGNPKSLPIYSPAPTSDRGINERYASLSRVAESQIERASFQEPMQRSYATPQDQLNSTFPHEGIPFDYYSPYPRSYQPSLPVAPTPQRGLPPTTNHNFHYESETFADHQHNPYPNEHPGFHGNDQRIINPHALPEANQYPAANQPPHGQLPGGVQSLSDSRYGHGTGESMSYQLHDSNQQRHANHLRPPQSAIHGQGYLDYGPTLEGQRLRTHPVTATERALELLAENERLQETLARNRAAMENRNQDYLQLQTKLKFKEEELQLSQERVNELNAQVFQLSMHLDRAIQEKEAIEFRCNENLREIESKLDGVLIEQLRNRK
ncbi:MAG TPA: hypothetical protein PKD64_16225 [Pirellulaceae bacterium]|nr:hypothetical protein [Pirellulaceae bacterium]HMO93736.1 hypothetical protein [Pirellulaceae bacterium]HMP69928.1 hypothetical protein [Pirellulaceae bacterium]